MYTSHVATMLSSMCMSFVSLAWLDFIPHIRALQQKIIGLHQKGIWSCKYGITVVVSANI